MKCLNSRRTTGFLIGLIFIIIFYGNNNNNIGPSKHKISFLKNFNKKQNGETYTKKDIDDILYRQFKAIEDRADNNNNRTEIRKKLRKSLSSTTTTMSNNNKTKLILQTKKKQISLPPPEKTIPKARGRLKLCLIGKPYGYLSEKHPGWSNFVLAVHHARRLAAQQESVVVIHSPHSKRFKLLWGGAGDVKFVDHWGKCHKKMTYKSLFYHFPFTSYTHFQMYKAKFYQKALKAMKKYRDEAGGKQIVSVHRRWFIENGKTQCEVRMKKCPQFCSKCGDREYKSKNVGTFKYTCHYTEENVRKKFKDEIDKDAFIILFTDGQSKEYDAKFTHRDKEPFQVQQVMMSMSDIHIGNPASSVDKVVGTWRWDRNKTTLPNDCYRYDHKHNAVL